MMRLSTWLWLALVAAVGYAIFQVKYEVMQLEDELARVNRSIDNDRDAMRVLNAEWSYLNQPARLDQLRQRYLALTPIGRAQLGSLDQVPFRPADKAEAPDGTSAPVVKPAAPAPAAPLVGSAHLVSAKTGVTP